MCITGLAAFEENSMWKSACKSLAWALGESISAKLVGKTCLGNSLSAYYFGRNGIASQTVFFFLEALLGLL